MRGCIGPAAAAPGSAWRPPGRGSSTGGHAHGSRGETASAACMRWPALLRAYLRSRAHTCQRPDALMCLAALTCAFDRRCCCRCRCNGMRRLTCTRQTAAASQPRSWQQTSITFQWWRCCWKQSTASQPLLQQQQQPQRRQLQLQGHCQRRQWRQLLATHRQLLAQAAAAAAQAVATATAAARQGAVQLRPWRPQQAALPMRLASLLAAARRCTWLCKAASNR